MSKFNPTRTVAPIYDAAEAWKDRCLLKNDSALSDGKNLWTTALLDELDRRFVKNLDEGEGDFLSKLKAQLSAGSSECLQLMAESLWLLLLFPSNIGATRKRETVREVWLWSGQNLEEGHPLLADAVLKGLGSAGTAFNINRWRELVFLIGAVRDLKSRETGNRESILGDPWTFSGWLSGLPEARHRQLLQIFPHLLFPDSFERISSEGDKRMVLAGFSGTPAKEIRKWETIQIDRSLLELRRRLEQEQGSDIDFYQKEFAAEWKTDTRTWLLSWNPARWSWDTLSNDRATTMAGDKAENRWRCSSTKPREGDRVFLIRTGTPPKGIVAEGQVTRAPYEAPHWEIARAESGETTRFIDVAFDAVRDASIDAIVPLDEIERREPGQEWNPQSSGIEVKGRPARTLERLWKALPPVSDVSLVPSPTKSGTISPSASGTPLNLILYGPPGTGRLID